MLCIENGANLRASTEQRHQLVSYVRVRLKCRNYPLIRPDLHVGSIVAGTDSLDLLGGPYGPLPIGAGGC